MYIRTRAIITHQTRYFKKGTFMKSMKYSNKVGSLPNRLATFVAFIILSGSLLISGVGIANAASSSSTTSSSSNTLS